MADNGLKEEKTKKCPFSEKWCEKSCALWNELTQQRGGMVMKIGICALNANVMLLSEINNRMAQQGRPVAKLQLPGMRGS